MSDRDPYEILGVERSATQEAIQRAYRKLAKQHHPDLNPGDAEAERLFKEVANAHDVLGDPEKRASFNRSKISADGQEKPSYAKQPTYDGAGFASQEGFASEAELQAFLNEMFGAGRADMHRRPMRGADVRLTISVPFIEACKGGIRRVRVPNRPAIDVTIPAGMNDGGILRVQGRGMPGYEGAPAGDAFIEVHITPHRHFKRKDTDILLDLPISFSEAVLGATIWSPTIHGPVNLKVPAYVKSGARL